MNKIKLLATLSVGIFIGYILTSLSAINTPKKSNLTLNKQTVTANTQVNQSTKSSPDNNASKVSPNGFSTEALDTASAAVTQVTVTNYQQLEDEYQQLNKAYQLSQSKIASLERELDQLNDSDISTQQMATLVVAQFKDYIGKLKGVDRDDIYKFHQADDDVDWGYNMQNFISDFVLTHYDANDINLISVICKQQQCELLVTEHVDGAWEKIIQDLAQQPWWQFTSSSSSSGNAPDSKNDIAIYTFLSV